MQDHVIGYCLSAVFGAGGLYHEFRWQQHLAKSEIISGRVVGEACGNNGLLPRVAYQFKGKERRFTSRYGGRQINFGQEVKVAHNRTNGQAEILDATNRWVWTVVPVGISIFVFVGTLLKHG